MSETPDLHAAIGAKDKVQAMTAGKRGVGAIGISRRAGRHAVVVYRSSGSVAMPDLPGQVDGVEVIVLDSPGAIRALA